MSLLEIGLAVFGSGGFAAAIIAFYKVRPERDVLVVKAAEGVVVIQTGLIDKLQKEIARVALDAANKEEECRQEIARLRVDSEGKIKALEEEIAALRRIVDRRTDL